MAESKPYKSDGKVIKEDYLMKESSFLKKSRKRYIILTKREILSFKENLNYTQWLKQTMKKVQPTEIFDLKEFHKVAASTGAKAKEFQFEIESDNCVRVFVAESYYEMEDWIAKIQNVQKLAQTNPREFQPDQVYDPEYYHRL